MLIHGQMAKAIAGIEAVGKNKEFKDVNGKSKWKFRGVDDTMIAVNKVMAETGLSLSVNYEVLSDEMIPSKDKTFNKAMVKGSYKIFAIDGSFIENSAIGLAYDYSDKAMNKAMAFALKYFLFQCFMIPTDEIAEGDSESPEPPKLPKGNLTNLIKAINGTADIKSLESMRAIAKKRDWTAEETLGIEKRFEEKRQEIQNAEG